LRPLWGRHAYKASLRSALPDSLQLCLDIWVSLHFVRSRSWLSFLLFLSVKPAMLTASMLRDYSTSASSMPSCFPRRTDLLGNPISHHVVTWSTFFSSFLLWTIISAILPSTMLGYYSMSASLMPSEFFHRRFDLLEACFL
jgi:hypothetical protein